MIFYIGYTKNILDMLGKKYIMKINFISFLLFILWLLPHLNLYLWLTLYFYWTVMLYRSVRKEKLVVAKRDRQDFILPEMAFLKKS